MEGFFMSVMHKHILMTLLEASNGIASLADLLLRVIALQKAEFNFRATQWFLLSLMTQKAFEGNFWLSCCSKFVSLEIGIGLTGFGVFFSFLGIIFFFDKGLLAMGNILFIAGLMLTIGLKSTILFFAKPKNYKGTTPFCAGFFLLLIGWPFFGMILEAYGFIVLFSGFWPTVAIVLQRLPIVGWIFRLPAVTSFFNGYRGKRVPV